MIHLTNKQREELEKLWFIYGNGGKKHTTANHGYIQGFLEEGKDRRVFYLNGYTILVNEIAEKGLSADALKKYELTRECIKEVEKIVYNKEERNKNESNVANR